MKSRHQKQKGTKSRKLITIIESKHQKIDIFLTWVTYILLCLFTISLITTLIFFLIYVPQIKNQSSINNLQNYEETKILLSIITVALAGLFGITKVIQYGIYLNKFERQILKYLL